MVDFDPLLWVDIKENRKVFKLVAVLYQQKLEILKVILLWASEVQCILQKDLSKIIWETLI